ncbi:MAG: hypothetical protein AAFQ43_03415, partial [Bacteroidota bacterium]
MSERRFTEEEVRRVFAAVAERQSSARADETGLSLAEMQEAAAASGLDPALVAAVAAEMVGGGDPDEIPEFLGAPLAVRKTRVLPLRLDDETWTRVVTELRRAYDTPGTPTELGTQREWTSGGVSGSPVHLVAVPNGSATVVTLEQTIAKDSKGAGWVVPISVILTTLMAAFFYFVGGLEAKIWLLPVLVGALTSLIVALLWVMWRSWARRTDTEFDRVLDRIELAALDAARASGAESDRRVSPEAPR